MKILYCNKYNFPFSGTEVYLFDLMKMMRAQGHEVALFSMADPRGQPTVYDRYLVPPVDFKKENTGLVGRAKLALHAIYSGEARRRLRRMIADFRPDVAHVRNIYHHLSPSILWELKKQNVPVLYHLNDFKLLCPSYNLVSKGNACERCRGGKFRHVMSEGCYSGPRGATALLAAEAYIHKWMSTYETCVDQFLAPSRFVKSKLIEHGWDESRIEILPHFQRMSELPGREAAADAPILYFGRLSQEKGITDLLRAMQRLPHIRLRIAGEGPQRTELDALVKTLNLANVEFIGKVGGVVLDEVIAGSRFTVLPSRAYETFGKSILESYAWGRAVVASDLGSRRELVHDGQTGLLFRPGDVDHLAEVISFLDQHPKLAIQMGEAGRSLVRQHYTPEKHYAGITKLYEGMVLSRKDPNMESVPTKKLALKTSGTQARDRSGSFAAALKALLQPKLRLAVETKPGPLRIAFIGGRGVMSKYSGIETYYEEVGKRLAAMGHEVTIYCRTYFTPSQREHHGMKLLRLPTVRSKHFETVVHTLLSTIHAMFSECDVVHYHALGPALFSFVPRLFGKKTIVTVQGMDWKRKKWGRIAATVLRLGERAAIQFPDATMSVSRTLQEHYRSRYQAETTYVPNGTTLRHRHPAWRLKTWGLESGRYILFLGRFSPEKNCGLLIEAYKKLDTTVKLVLAGGSSHTDEYAKQLREHGDERICMLDWVSGDALEELLTNAMLFVLPSDIEGLSLALLDAMGAGVCVLASDIPENCELVERAGFTFRRGDAADLQRMLGLLISDEPLRKMAESAARQRIREGFLWPQIIEQIEQVYRKALGRGSMGESKTVDETPELAA
ncbi:MAG TPA: glycosyltransferase family 4 protein [Terriglobales bacterium]|nr:glycosyltransferase family 4 protein [Terriglobales bacterium]